MDKKRSEPDHDLDRGIEPLRTVFAIGVLILGFAAGARAETALATPGPGVGEGRVQAYAARGYDAGRCIDDSDVEPRDATDPGHPR